MSTTLTRGARTPPVFISGLLGLLACVWSCGDSTGDSSNDSSKDAGTQLEEADASDDGKQGSTEPPPSEDSGTLISADGSAIDESVDSATEPAVPGGDCQDSRDCAVGVCDERFELCVECIGDNDCEEPDVCLGKQCVPRRGCGSDIDCKAIDLLCDTELAHCVQCLENGHCEEGEVCENGSCVPEPCDPLSLPECLDDDTLSFCNDKGVDSFVTCGDGMVCNWKDGIRACIPEADVCPKEYPAICHEFYAADNGRNNLNYLNEFDPAQNWSVSVGDTGVNSPRQIAIVDNPDAQTGKAVLVSTNRGYGEYDVVDGAELVRVLTFSGVTGVVRLPNGNTAMGIGNDNIRIVNPAGSTVDQFALPGSGDLRLLHRDNGGNYWFGRQLDIFQVDDQGGELWSAQLPSGGKATAVVPRVGGGAYATSGGVATVVEYNAGSEIVSQVGGKTAFPSLGLDYLSGFVRLANGNVVAANWLGHVQPTDDQPHLVEFTPDNELVWQWGNQILARQVTNVYVIR